MDIEFLNGGVPVQIKSVKVGYYLGAQSNEGGFITLASTLGLNLQTFRLWRIDENKVSFQANGNQYLGVKSGVNGNRLLADSNTVGESEKFEIVRNCDDLKRIRIKAYNGLFLQVISSTVVTADLNSVSGWKNDDPSVFTMTIMERKDGAETHIWTSIFETYLGAENGGGKKIVANRTRLSFWEYFKFGTIKERKVSFMVSNGLFMGLGSDKNLVAISNKQGESEKFVIVRNQHDPDRIRIRASNGLFLQVKSRRQVTADFDGYTDNGWGNNDPSVFMVTVLYHENEVQIQLKAVGVGNYLCAENGGGEPIVADRADALAWETFTVCSMHEERFSFKIFNGQFMGLENGTNKLIAVSETPGKLETFEIVRNPNDARRIRIKAQNGKFLQVQTKNLVTADHNGANGWESYDPSVFYISIKSSKEESEEVQTHKSNKELQCECPNPNDFANCMSTFKSLLSQDFECLLEKHQKELLLATADTLSKSTELYGKQRSFLAGFHEKVAQLSASLATALAEKHEASRKLKEREDLGNQLKGKKQDLDAIKQVNEQLKKEIYESLDEFTHLQTRIKVLEEEITQKNKIIQANIAKTKAQQLEHTDGMEKLAHTNEEVLDWETARDSANARCQKILKEWSSFKDLFP